MTTAKKKRLVPVFFFSFLATTHAKHANSFLKYCWSKIPIWMAKKIFFATYGYHKNNIKVFILSHSFEVLTISLFYKKLEDPNFWVILAGHTWSYLTRKGNLFFVNSFFHFFDIDLHAKNLNYPFIPCDIVDWRILKSSNLIVQQDFWVITWERGFWQKHRDL